MTYSLPDFSAIQEMLKAEEVAVVFIENETKVLLKLNGRRYSHLSPNTTEEIFKVFPNKEKASNWAKKMRGRKKRVLPVLIGSTFIEEQNKL